MTDQEHDEDRRQARWLTAARVALSALHPDLRCSEQDLVELFCTGVSPYQAAKTVGGRSTSQTMDS